MGKKKPNTPRSFVRGMLRKIFLQSRERAAALKRDGYCCTECGVKQSTAKGKEVKVQVDHIYPMEEKMNALIYMVFEVLIPGPEHFQTLCKECHTSKTAKEREARNGEKI